MSEPTLFADDYDPNDPNLGQLGIKMELMIEAAARILPRRCNCCGPIDGEPTPPCGHWAYPEMPDWWDDYSTEWRRENWIDQSWKGFCANAWRVMGITKETNDDSD